MQFTFYNNLPGSPEVEATGEAYGFATERAGNRLDSPGFYVDLNDEQAARGWVDFTISELRQMLSEAQELQDKLNGETGNGTGCDCAACDCQGTYAPLAGPDEDVPPADEPAPKTNSDIIADLLDRAQFVADTEGDAALAQAYIAIAQARARL